MPHSISSATTLPEEADVDHDHAHGHHAPKRTPKGSAFWLAFMSIVSSIFLSALDLTAVSTVLPTVTADLNGGDEFTWVGSAYALASTAILPLCGALSDIFGRKPVMQIAIILFSLGSALAGSAKTMNWLIGARTVQGIGGGAISFLSMTLVSDLVPLNERGLYQGIISLTWAFASGVGPPIGGALAEKATWRWLFYLNLPVTGIAFTLVFFFLSVKTPEGSITAKLKRVDWVGNFIIIAGSTMAIVGLTFGGIRFPWVSAQVLAPLIIGVATIAGFIIYEKHIPSEPAIPWEVLANRTSLSGYITTMCHGIVMISLIYYLPVYFQATLGSGPLGSSVKSLPSSLIIAPFALCSGLSVHFLGRYKPSIFVGWVLLMVGCGILSLLRADDTIAQWVGYQFIVAAGVGVLFSSPIFSVLAALPVERTASATATFVFCRSFAQTWGITISSTVLQNELKKKLPAAFSAQFQTSGVEIAYAAIPYIHTLQEPLKSEVRAAFADSLSVVWKVMVGVGGLGLLSWCLMREIPMRAVVDRRFGLEKGAGAGESEEDVDVEAASAVTHRVDGDGGENEKQGHEAEVDVQQQAQAQQQTQQHLAQSQQQTKQTQQIQQSQHFEQHFSHHEEKHQIEEDAYAPPGLTADGVNLNSDGVNLVSDGVNLNLNRVNLGLNRANRSDEVNAYADGDADGSTVVSRPHTLVGSALSMSRPHTLVEKTSTEHARWSIHGN